MGTHLQAVLGMYWKHMFIVAKKVIIGNGNTCIVQAVLDMYWEHMLKQILIIGNGNTFIGSANYVLRTYVGQCCLCIGNGPNG